MASEVKNNTAIISAELTKLADSFEQFNPGNNLAESGAVFGTLEGEITGIGNIAQQALGIIVESIAQLGTSFTSAETGISGVQISLGDLAAVISSVATDLKSLEAAMKDTGSASGNLHKSIKDSDDGSKEFLKTTSSFLKNGKDVTTLLGNGIEALEKWGKAAKTAGEASEAAAGTIKAAETAVNATGLATTAAAGGFAKLSAALGIAGVAFQALSLIVSAFQYINEKAEERQKEFTESLRASGEAALKFNEIMAAEVDSENIGYYAGLADNLDTAILLIDEAREKHAQYGEEIKALQDADYNGSKYLELLQKQSEVTQELDEGLKGLGLEVESVGKVMSDNTVFYDMLAEASEHIKGSMEELPAKMLEAEAVSASFTSSINQQTASMEKLESTYISLAEGEELSTQNLMELAQLYPEVAAVIDDTTTSQEDLMDAIEKARKVSKNKTIEELKNKKAELVAESGRLEAIIKGYEAEDEAHNTKTENEKKDLQSYHTYAEGLLKSFNAGWKLAGVVPEIVGDEGKRALYEAALEKLEKTNEAIKSADAQIALLNKLSDTINYEPASKGGSKKSISGGGKVKLEIKEELEEELSEYQLAWEKYKKLQEENQDISLESRKKWLDDNLEKVQKSQEEETQYKKEYNNLLKEISKEAISSIEKIASAEEDSAESIIANLQDLKDAYADYEDVVKAVEKKITEVTAEETEKRNAEIKKAADARKTETDEIIKEIEKRHQVLKSYEGLRYGSGDNDVFKYTTDMEINRINELIAALETYVSGFKNRMEPLNEYEEKLLADAEATLEKHYDTRQELYMKHLKEQQDALEAAYKEKEKIYQQEFKVAENAYKETTAMIKSQYDERIQAAKAAADKEIAILQKQINEIDKLMAKQAIDEQDDNYNKKRNQLEQLIAYEVDDGNKYELQKELSRLNEEYEKRKQKEALEAQKSALQEEMNNVRDRLNQETQALEDMRDSELKTMEAQFEQKKVQYERETEIREEELKKQQALIVTNAALELEETNETVDQKLKIYKRDTGNHKSQLNEQEKNIDFFRTSVYQKYEETSTEVRQLGENTVTYILEYLYSRISDFADAGRRAGNAYADAFERASRSAASYVDGFSLAMSSNLMNVSAQASSFLAAGAASQAFVSASGNSQETQNNEVTIYQTITAPVATPSMVAKETKRELQQALRYS